MISLERELDAAVDPRALCAAIRRPGGATVYLEGSDPDGWATRVGLVVSPELRFRRPADGDPGGVLERLDALVLRRRAAGGSPSTGVAAVLGFDLLAPVRARAAASVPDVVALAVDASVDFVNGRPPVLTVRPHPDGSPCAAGERIDRSLARAATSRSVPARPAAQRARTTLPRPAYLEAVAAVKGHIRRGDIYQANLTQQFTVGHDGDPFDLFTRLSRRLPAPHAAFLEDGDLALASVSPETFLRVSPEGSIETRPIKGTRPRGRNPVEDRALAEDLLRSAKDRAELLMIVDLERNDLGRVSRTGSVRVSALAELRSYAAVHHLVARVHGDLREGVLPSELLRATFPGGSVTGAPKTRALEILRALEPVGRNFYTGCLIWFGDDGSVDSSILIRTVVLCSGRAWLGSGGAIVADSDPEGEWAESNHKARHLAEELGFVPEEAT